RRGPLLLFIAPSPPALYTLSLHDALPIFGELRGLLEEQACLLLTLTQLITLIGEPRSGLLHDAMVNRQVDDGGFPGYTLTVDDRSEEHTSELQSRFDLVCRLLLEKKKQKS